MFHNNGNIRFEYISFYLIILILNYFHSPSTKLFLKMQDNKTFNHYLTEYCKKYKLNQEKFNDRYFQSNKEKDTVALFVSKYGITPPYNWRHNS